MNNILKVVKFMNKEISKKNNDFTNKLCVSKNINPILYKGMVNCIYFYENTGPEMPIINFSIKNIDFKSFINSLRKWGMDSFAITEKVSGEIFNITEKLSPYNFKIYFSNVKKIDGTYERAFIFTHMFSESWG